MRRRGTRLLRAAALAGIVWTALAVPAAAQTVVQVTEAIGQDAVWTPDNTYVLNGFVFVEDGVSLTIEPGTVVRGKPGQGENASALIVAQGGRIFAEGTRENPIIFTAEADDVSDPFDLPLDTRGLWGGVILLGKAVINTSTGVGAIEGIPTTEPRGAYGGSDDSDDSGVFRYVSIRYGGTDIGAGNEINGLTMGAVGSGTVVEYVEVYNNQDDGFEWFGGTVNSRYLVSASTATTPSTSTKAGAATTSSGSPCRPRRSATAPASTTAAPIPRTASPTPPRRSGTPPSSARAWAPPTPTTPRP